jgi:thiamine-phosphate diphosphorylase
MNRPTLCLITDRHRLLRGLGRPAREWRALLMAQIAGAASGGVDVVQVRERDLGGRELMSLLRDAIQVAGPHCRVIVNDRLDAAVAAGAGGVHLRERGVPLSDARVLVGPRSYIGCSVHGAGTALQARTADYLIAGSVYATASKPGQTTSLGIDGLSAIVRAAGPCPVWAVGGITPERVVDVVRAGARGVAAIGGFVPAPSGNLAEAVALLVGKWRFSLDTAVELP